MDVIADAFHEGDAGKSTAEPIGEEEETIVDDGEKNMLLSIISQLRPGADLSRITLPTFILEPKSMLERITNFMQHPETLLPMTAVDDPTQRFISVVKFYLSGWHIKPPGVKKPLNPILGEYFTCHWDFNETPGTQAFYISEQTSHHPPKSSYFYMAPHHGIRIDGTLKPQSRFLGNSAASMMNTSVVVLRLLNRGTTAGKPDGGEKYILTQPNMYVRGILFGKMKYELGDHSYIKCPELDLMADIDFKVKGFFTGAYNAIGGQIKRESTGEVLYEITGSWSGEMFIKDCLTGKRDLLFDATNAAPTPPIVRPLSEQDERESQKLWGPVTTALKSKDQEGATDAKFKIEDRQREEARLREADGVEWKPRFFRAVDPSRGEDEQLDWIISTNIDGTTPEEQIKQILNIAPIITGARRASKYDIPPHHPHTETVPEGAPNEADEFGPGLIPTNRGVTTAAGHSTRPEARQEVRHSRSGSGVSTTSARSASSVRAQGRGVKYDDSDEFVDAEER
ncbi:uncharacterized protein H6S33_005385 [Morchella sextelata]|uniref:uncharacterized protein n=1 Tax=Morchella sextelata TaxID=1174677 RepID=UPI001D0470D5|nr:uncharacterized protein H6S33_005385 [Morchella sextelata]KAH0613499.1 hypothetical protein H6S33_005385 [Morchella sextelata]